MKLRAPANQHQCLQLSHNSLANDTEIDKLQMDQLLNFGITVS